MNVRPSKPPERWAQIYRNRPAALERVLTEADRSGNANSSARKLLTPNTVDDVERTDAPRETAPERYPAATGRDSVRSQAARPMLMTADVRNSSEYDRSSAHFGAEHPRGSSSSAVACAPGTRLVAA
ncbi:hypothetical protein [Nocardia macrotermitis]|uniref:Uncharacterized protein n=1 Tax=Nocardia macrotermitis TaxID=2585198 RepID=A0A7K0CXG8_9NOCA|nr:hypothetical protein [Nocardia macrotermitis]MQY18186.1 hypothetical protein [Nocardia macrotermitis]